ncbi:MAG: prolyl oligopeptidase family serine peptidase [Cyclobacteriaceae bacterium]
MKRLSAILLSIFFVVPLWAQNFSFEDIKGYPFPNELTAAATGSRIAWAVNEQGKRNIYVAEGPGFAMRKLTNYNQDDGQEISSLQISADGNWVVYVRGGDHGSNWGDAEPVNPMFNPTPPKVQIWSIPFAGGEPKAIGDGDEPVISPKSDVVAFVKGGQIWTTPIDGATAGKALFNARGRNGAVEWSPDGSRIAFVSDRGDHSFIGVYTSAETPIKWMAPSYDRDRSPRWSPDGSRIVFVRMNGSGGVPDPILERQHRPWTIMIADVAKESGTRIWKAPSTLRGSIPSTHGGFNLHWGAGDRIVYLSYEDGWPHLYSIAASGGSPMLLTPGNFMAEYIKMSPDRKWMVFCGNTGPDKLDIDRRHVIRVSVDKANMEVLTPGTGLEWTPAVTGDGSTIAMISATPQRPPLVAVKSFDAKGSPKLLGESLIPPSFPKNLVTPKQVVFQSPDGVTVHGQLFETTGGAAKKPGIIYVHGGPPRQMLLGWHYSDYYSNAYATNQYLASLGFVVLSVNYRLGIGYGYEFHQPDNAGTNGASEYIDVKAGGEWLARQPQVDASKIGIYGGSYGGYLTAMALGRDSKLFAAGVDVHGVHDRTVNRIRNYLMPDQYEKAPDAAKAAEVAWQSSPVSSVDTWTSPVLIIHGDDDRNVRFDQSTDLVQRLQAKGVPMETLVIVDDTHHWMMHANSLKAGKATADFFVRKLKK